MSVKSTRVVAVWSSGALVYPDVTKAAGTVTVDWGSAPTAAEYRVVVGT